MASLLLTAASAFLYGLASAMCIYVMLRKESSLTAPSKLLFITAVILQTASIGMTSVSTSGTLVTGPNILMLSAWAVAVIACLLVALNKRAYGFIALSGVAAAVLMLASWALDSLYSGAPLTNSVYYEWPTLVLHISLIFLSAALFAISAGASLMQLHQQRLIRKKSDKLLGIKMPSVNTASTAAKRFSLAGFLAFTMGILIGFARLFALNAAMAAVGCGGDLGYLEPRVVFSALVWLVCFTHFVVSYIVPHRVSSRVRAGISVAAFALVLVLIVVSAG